MNRQAAEIIRPGQGGTISQIGGKAYSLDRLMGAGFDVPGWFVVTRGEGESAREMRGLSEAIAELGDGAGLFAVRSSSVSEDGAEQSFAGQFESYLGVRGEQVAGRVDDVRRSGMSERVLAYRRERGLTGEAEEPAVLVQRLIKAEASGVAFSADPVTGRRGVAVVSAVWGLGTALVGGEADADAFYVDERGRIIERRIAEKVTAHRADAESRDGIRIERITVGTRGQTVGDETVRAIAKLARDVARFAGSEQDIEWAVEGGRVWLLQSRPITTLGGMTDPDGRVTIWDNSNIIESYPGVTLPLTYSFAREAYEQVYRQFCRMMGVPVSRIEDNANVFGNMIGLIRGRVYYHLINWYRVLAMLPGFKANRSFMEQMMGVDEKLPEGVMEEAGKATAGERWADRAALARSVMGMVWRHITIERSVKRFYERLERILGAGRAMEGMRMDELAEEYRRLERGLLTHWDAPLVNDFFAMIFFGLLGKLTAKYTGKTGLHNALLADSGGMISAEPAKRIAEMAEIAAKEAEVVEVLCKGSVRQAEGEIDKRIELRTAYRGYLEKFGERCMEELKLESPTLVDDPTPLLRSIGNAAKRTMADKTSTARYGSEPGEEAKQIIERAMEGKPMRRAVFQWVLRQAKARVRGRENLRFERTRVFGRVRRIMVEIGRRMAAEDKLDEARDVFYLELREVLGFIEGTISSVELRGLVEARKRVYERYRGEPVPADRFETRGAVHVGNDFTAKESAAETARGSATETARGNAAETAMRSVTSAGAMGAGASGVNGGDGMNARGLASATALTGTGCCAGRVTGRARVIVDPVGAQVQQGEILVAERTDPGWIMLFPAAAGVLVQRGSMLSHSAIVARELNIPAIVSIPQLMQRINSGDLIEMDGTSGLIRIIARNRQAGTDDNTEQTHAQ